MRESSEPSIGTYKMVKRFLIVLAFVGTSLHVDTYYRQVRVTTTTDASYSSSSSRQKEKAEDNDDLLLNELHLVRLEHLESKQNQTIQLLQNRTKELELQLEQAYRKHEDQLMEQKEQAVKEGEEAASEQGQAAKEQAQKELEATMEALRKEQQSQNWRI